MKRILILIFLLLSQACNPQHTINLPELVNEVLYPTAPTPHTEPSPQATYSEMVQVSNLHIWQQARTLIFNYDLTGPLAEQDEVILEYSLDQGNSWIRPLGLKGDIGPKIEVGNQKEIHWDVLAEFRDGIKQSLQFRLESLSERVPETEVATPAEPLPSPEPQVQSPQKSQIREPITGIELVWVEGGCFRMGCDPKTAQCQDPRKPLPPVCLDGFYMGVTEVTQGQWRKVMKNNPAKYKKGDDYPVENVSWHDARDFIRKLNSLSSMDFRLPTEPEWEYSCRSGGKDEEFCGNVHPGNLAWHSHNSGGHPQPVASKAANGLGIYDMSGNVWEWVFDKYSSLHTKKPPANPRGPTPGVRQTIRGGSWSSSIPDLKSVNRAKSKPGNHHGNLGFRLVLAKNRS